MPILSANDFCKKYKIAGVEMTENTFRQRLNSGIFPPKTVCQKTSTGWMIYFNESDFIDKSKNPNQ